MAKSWGDVFKMAAREWTLPRILAIWVIMGLLWLSALKVFPSLHFWVKIIPLALAGPFITQLVYRIIPKPSLTSDRYDEPSEKVRDLVRQGRKLDAIKLYRQETGAVLGLKEAMSVLDRVQPRQV